MSCSRAIPAGQGNHALHLNKGKMEANNAKEIPGDASKWANTTHTHVQSAINIILQNRVFSKILIYTNLY